MKMKGFTTSKAFAPTSNAYCGLPMGPIMSLKNEKNFFFGLWMSVEEHTPRWSSHTECTSRPLLQQTPRERAYGVDLYP